MEHIRLFANDHPNLIVGATSSFGQTVSEEAWRHFDAGVAATKTADYEAARKSLI